VLWSDKIVKIGPRPATFSLQPLKSDRLLASASPVPAWLVWRGSTFTTNDQSSPTPLIHHTMTMLRLIIIFGIAILIAPVAFSQEPPEVERLIKEIPKAVASFISRRVECNHWGGE